MIIRKQGDGAVVSISGGMDSAVALYLAIARFGGADKVHAISFNYGQKHGTELSFAKKVAEAAGVKHSVIELPPSIWAASNSYLTNPDVDPEKFAGEDYDALQARLGAQPSVVPGRNLNFLAMTASYAESNGIPNIVIGNHAGDAHNYHYPDCTEEFIQAASLAILIGSDGAVTVHSPFVHQSKGDIVALGEAMGVPFELTQTCYRGMTPACGECASCLERLAAFEEADAVDPIEYVKIPSQYMPHVKASAL